MSGSSGLSDGIPPRYQVERELGHGEMGRVVAAFDTILGRRVAIRLLPAPPPGDAAQQQDFQRFRREAQLAGGLRHAHILGIHDVGADAQSAWMVMEIVEGGTLREWLQANPDASLAEMTRIMGQLLDALAFCHDQGIIHGDVTPANIMLTEPSGRGEVKLAGFGRATPLRQPTDDAEATLILGARGAAERIAHPGGLAPEQFTGGAPDPRTDLWAAGIVLYQMLTREEPFTGEPAAIEAQILAAEPLPPSQRAARATPAFDALIRRALSKRPEARFQDARSFAAALRDATRAQGVGPSSPPPPVIPPVIPPPAARGWIKFAAAGGVAAIGIALALTLIGGPEPAAPGPAPIANNAEPPRPAAVARLETPLLTPTPTPAPVGLLPPPAVTPAAPALVAPPTNIAPATPAPTPPPTSVAPAAPILAAPPVSVTPGTPTPAATPATLAPTAPGVAAPLASVTPAPPAPAASATLAAPVLAAPPANVTSAAPALTAPPANITPATPAPAASAANITPPAPAPAAPAANVMSPLAPAAPSAPTALALIPPAPPKPDPAQREAAIQAALADVQAPDRCGLLQSRREGDALTLTGFLHQRDAAPLREGLVAAGLSPRIEASLFDAPYCPLLAAIRPGLTEAHAPPRITPRASRLRDNERLALDFEMPDWPATINLWFVMHDGQALRLLGDLPMHAGERRMMSQTTPAFPWIISEPFGFELLIVVASEGALFAAPRPMEESVDSLTEALRGAMQQARAEGRRLVTRAAMIETMP
ncbi:serine/threonine protein kinase [Sediminicoccus sp. KRV36]|uniref:serine/threonine protein kinase n=1 Tax=Sediminicoccus sp. KRV36 TaxID=3133721 RepID=UPI00200D3486|nr:serine/threonine protein kinase [Sediminicoccus rosea]UPY36456.1 serine/threonine-protein kinase [Sediminicoccus rosea]